MTSHFGPDFFTSNRDRLREQLQTDAPIVIAGNGSMQRAADAAVSFHQDSSFWYLTGLDQPDLVLVMLAGSSYLMVPNRSAQRTAFDGSHDMAAYASRSGIGDIVSPTVGWGRLREALIRSRQVVTLASPPAFDRQHGLHTLPFRRRLITSLKRARPGIDIRDAGPVLAAMRCLKRPEELAALQQAIDITSATLQELTQPSSLKQLHHEYELEAAISYGFRSRGARGHAFAPIVGAGQHATTLHYQANEGPIGAHALVVVDVGAEVEHYAADITRTISKSPLSRRQQAVFDAVSAVQDYALSLLKPGVLAQDYEKAVETYMGERLTELGLMKTPEPALIRRYFPHATSHFLGLDTHDVGDYRKPMQAGMVVTCEPGIYIPEEGIGVRLEDDVLITPGGNQVLSAACPRRLAPVQ